MAFNADDLTTVDGKSLIEQGFDNMSPGSGAIYNNVKAGFNVLDLPVGASLNIIENKGVIDAAQVIDAGVNRINFGINSPTFKLPEDNNTENLNIPIQKTP